MTLQVKKLLAEMQVRKSVKEKRAFRAWLAEELRVAGWQVTEEKNGYAGHNVVVGDPEKAKVLYTAHYDTQAVLPFPNLITPRSLGGYLAFQGAICVGMILITVAVMLFAMLVLKASQEVGLLSIYLICLFFVWWMYFGKANQHTVNDNTSGVATLLEVALTMPRADRDKVCLIFFDNEERGMLGSAKFAARHKRVKKETLVLNFDCVSDGDFIHFFPAKALRGEEDVLTAVERAFLPIAGKSVEVYREKSIYPSDNASFRRAFGVCALKRKGTIYYMDRIHTSKDTVWMEENIELLRQGCLRFAEDLD